MTQDALFVEEPVSVIFGADDYAPSAVARPAGQTRRWSVGKRRGDIVAGRPALRRWVWLAAGLAAAATIFGLAKPAAVIRVMPRLAAVYRAVGMPINLRGMAFDHVTARFQEAAGARFLVVEGIVRNVARDAQRPPRLRIVVSGADGRPIYQWTASSGIASLGPGEVAPFRARLAAPPAEARGVTVDFAPDEASPK